MGTAGVVGDSLVISDPQAILVLRHGAILAGMPGGHVLELGRLRLGRASPLAFAVLVACGGGSQTLARPPPVAAPSAPPVAPVGEGDAGARDAFADPGVSLSEDDCRAFGAASALGAAVVVSVQSDCSGVGHHRIVLEVRRLARGERISTIVTSRPLAAPDRHALAVGDTLVIAIEPERRAAETVYCVALPAHEGKLRHAIEVDSLATAGHVLDELEAGRACSPRR